MNALASILHALALSMIGSASPASAQNYPFKEWARLWDRTCGSIDAAYSIINSPEANGWKSADAETDEEAARVIEAANLQSQGAAEDAVLTGFFVLRQRENARPLVAFQEMQFADQPNQYLLACALYDTSAPNFNASELAQFSSERPFSDKSNNGMSVIEWQGGSEGSGRIKMTAGSIPSDHPGAQLLLGGLVLKTLFVFTEETE